MMEFSRISLFFGVEVTEELDQALQSVNPHLLMLLIHNDSEYLHEYHEKGTRYLGKNLGTFVEGKALDLIEANIKSLLKKLVPSYPLDKISFQLLTVIPK